MSREIDDIVSILLGGMAVLVKQRATWLFGMLFSVVGMVFMVSGITGS